MPIVELVLYEFLQTVLEESCATYKNRIKGITQRMNVEESARVVELVDTTDLKSVFRKEVPVQFRPRAHFSSSSLHNRLEV